MKDHARIQIDKARREHRRIEQENVTFEQFQANAKAKRYPTGSTYAWAAECVFGPVDSAKKDKNNANTTIETGKALQRSEG